MFVLGTAGHVDHGKSSFLRALTSMEPDRLPEEKKRGLTIELNFVWFETAQGEKVGIIDVPGHHRFVKNMIMGMTIDAFLFVVAADDGWMPQSEEHLQVLRSLGVCNGIGILTKVDLAKPERVQEVHGVLEQKLEEAFGKPIEVVHFAAPDPSNMGEIRKKVETLLGKLPRPKDVGTPRLWVDRVFVPKGMGIVATGTLREGTLKAGDEVTILPSGKKAQVKGLQAYQQHLQEVSPVSRVAVQLSKIQTGEVVRGCLIEGPIQTPTTEVADAKVEFLSPVKKGNIQLALHIGTLRKPALLIPLEKTGEGHHYFSRLKFLTPTPLRSGDRFLLRTPGEERTVVGGIIIDPLPGASSHKQALERLKSWKEGAKGFLDYVVTKDPLLDLVALSKQSIYSKEQLGAEISKDAFTELEADMWVPSKTWAAWKEAVKKNFLQLHQSNKEMVSEGELSKAVESLCISKKALQLLLSQLVQAKEIRRVQSGFQLATFERKVDPWERECEKRIGTAFQGSQGLPLPTRELGTETQKVLKVIRRLVKEGRLTALADDHFLPAEAYEAIKDKVVGYLKEKGQAKTSDLRGYLNTSRKNAVLLLEKMDRDRITFLKDGIRRLLR